MLRFVLLATCLVNLGLAKKPAEVKISTGKVKGHFIKDDMTDAEYYAFKCIPYAKPPVGDLRFKAPVKAEELKEVLDRQSCEECAQVHLIHRDNRGSEDCLTVNVYTKIHPDDVNKTEPLPVIAYIHASEWKQETAGDYSPSFFMEKVHKSVILVVFNYRLGAFGFLSTGDNVVSGNNGLKDQVMALQWIKENINAFGGNADRVTLYGSSTGAASVRFHMLSPKSRGLFAAAIAQSGNELNPWSWHDNNAAANLYTKLAKHLGCDLATNQETINCMRTKTAEEILNANTVALKEERKQNLLFTFKPVTEVESEEAFLSENPLDMLEAGKEADIPLIIGMTAYEGAYKYVEYANWSLIDELGSHLNWLMPTSTYSIQHDVVYPGHKKNFINLISDTQYKMSHVKVINELMKSNRKSPVYQYMYNFNGTTSFTLYYKSNTENLGPAHYDDELMMFDPRVYFDDYVRTPEDKDMSNKMIGMYINFAINHNPNVEGDDWKPITETENLYFRIDDSTTQHLKKF